MKINSITPFKINNLYNLKPLNYIKTNRLQNFDSVSFGGTHLKYQNNSNVKEALKLGLAIYESGANFENVSKLLKSKIPEMNVLPIEEAPVGLIRDVAYDALYTYYIYKDGNTKDFNMYIAKNPKDNSDIYELKYAMEVAHEYTHGLQILKNEDIAFLNKLTNDDFDYLESLVILGDSIFSIFDNDVRSIVITPSFDIKDKFEASILGIVVPREKQVTKKSLLEKAGHKNREAFNKYIKAVFKQVSEDTVSFALNNEDTKDSEVLKPVIEKIQQKNGKDDLISDLMKYCSYSAKKEAQAYTTECMLAKKVLGINSAINRDVLPFYYEMLEEALK